MESSYVYRNARMRRPQGCLLFVADRQRQIKNANQYAPSTTATSSSPQALGFVATGVEEGRGGASILFVDSLPEPLSPLLLPEAPLLLRDDFLR